MILALPLKAKKVLVIDDEIKGITLETALNDGKDLFDELQDINSPVTDEIINIINNDFKEYSNLIENQDFSLDLIKNVFLNKDFQEKLTDDTKNLFTPINDKNSFLGKIRTAIEESFPKPLYEIEFLLNHNEANDLEVEKFDLLILDWFLSANVSNEDYIKDTLSKIDNLPPIILITSHPNINKAEVRASFFEKTRISASGLTTLTKAKILSSNFGSSGLSKISSTLIKQREISNNIRSYIKDWEEALENAKRKTLSTLWQLDTFIIKSIQEDATIDGQPYHDHFHNFIERENSWHIEKEFDTKSNIESLGELLEKHSYNDILTYYTDESSFKLHREVLTHYSFKGYNRRLRIPSKTSSSLRKNILHDIPFGAVLKPKDINEKSDIAYINITQACDLSNICRSPSSSNSIVLLKSQLIKRNLKESFIFDTSNYIITSFPINNDFYDLKPLPMSIVSNSFKDFYDYSVKNNLYVVGEVRNDIAVGLQQKAITHLIRPSQQRVQRPSISSAKMVYLQYYKTQTIDENGTPIYETLKVEYSSLVNIIGTKNQETRKSYLQFTGLDPFDFSTWILSNVKYNEVTEPNLLSFFNQQIEVNNSISDKKINSLNIKFIKIESIDAIDERISTIKMNKNSESIFIFHQLDHL